MSYTPNLLSSRSLSLSVSLSVSLSLKNKSKKKKDRKKIKTNEPTKSNQIKQKDNKSFRAQIFPGTHGAPQQSAGLSPEACGSVGGASKSDNYNQRSMTLKMIVIRSSTKMYCSYCRELKSCRRGLYSGMVEDVAWAPPVLSVPSLHSFTVTSTFLGSCHSPPLPTWSVSLTTPLARPLTSSECLPRPPSLLPVSIVHTL